jgi:type IV pilus assembly protein PilA
MTSRLQAKLLAQRALFQRLQSSKKRSKLQAGFTLVELLIVIVIIGILSAVAIPNFIAQRDRAYSASATTWAAGEARKCAAALLTGNATDFDAQIAPTGLTGVTTGGTGVGVACAAGNTWTVTIDGFTTTYAANANGTVTKS